MKVEKEEMRKIGNEERTKGGTEESKRGGTEKRRRRKQKVGGWTSGGCLLRFHLMVFLVLTLWSNAVSSIDLTRLLQHRTI